MSKPTTPLDSELAKIFGNNTRIFRAMRELFKQAGDLSPSAIEEALIAAGNAGTAANQALDVIERLTQAVELLALMPRTIDNIEDDDLAPRQEFVIPDTLADLSPAPDAPGTDNSTNVTLAGTPNYITIAGQVITRTLINLASHVTGLLPLNKGGTGSITLTAAEISQIENINLVTLSNTQWAFLGQTEDNPYAATLTAGSGTITLNPAGDTLRFARLTGKRVHVSGQINVSSVSAPSGSLRLNLPVAAVSLADQQELSAGSIGYGNVNAIGSPAALVMRIPGAGSAIGIVEQTTTTFTDDVASHIKSGTFLWFDFMYTVA